MKIVILAAGKGTRLGKKDVPKPLTLLANDKSILQQQIDNLSPHFPLHDIIIVVGYRKELIMEVFPNLSFVENPNFSQENTSKSLLRAIRSINEDVLWLNGDVVFHPNITQKVIANGKTLMVVNKGAVGEEEVKYRTDSSGRIVEVSKQVVNPQGEALGINFFKAKDLKILCKHLDKCQNNDYFEKGIETAIQEGLEVWTLAVDQTECAEVDYPEDLARANRLIKNWK